MHSAGYGVIHLPFLHSGQSKGSQVSGQPELHTRPHLIQGKPRVEKISGLSFHLCSCYGAEIPDSDFPCIVCSLPMHHHDVIQKGLGIPPDGLLYQRAGELRDPKALSAGARRMSNMDVMDG